MPYYHKIRFHPDSGRCPRVVKHDIPGIDKETALKVLFLADEVPVSDMGPMLRDLQAIVPLDGPPVPYKADIERKTVRMRSPYGSYYTEPGPVTKAMTLVRTNPDDGTQPDRVDVVSLPVKVVNFDCTGDAAIEHLKYVAREYVKTPAGDQTCRENGGRFTWTDLTYADEGFLRRYGVILSPVDTMLGVTVRDDEDLLKDVTEGAR